MALTNRVMIAIGTSNLGCVIFWEWVFSDLGPVMNTDTRSFLIVKDHNHTYRKNYQEKNRHETKKSWDAEPKNEGANGKTKQRIDDTRGATYGARVVIETDTFQIPPLIKGIEAKHKIELKIECPLPGYYINRHKTNRSKLCKYWG